MCLANNSSIALEWILFHFTVFTADEDRVCVTQVVRGLEGEERCALLKFVTSCSRAPLLGFKHLQPAFTIHKVHGRSLYWHS